jgi:hypothetical protein
MVLHADDIRAALGRELPADVDTKAAASHIADILTQREWRPATIALDGLPTFDVSGGGEPITGPAWPFVLAATGRGDLVALNLDESANIYG